MVTQDTLHVCKRKLDVSEIELRFATYIAINKCFEQIELPISFHTCAPISELPYNRSTIVKPLCLLAKFLSAYKGIGPNRLTNMFRRMR